MTERIVRHEAYYLQLPFVGSYLTVRLMPIASKMAGPGSRLPASTSQRYCLEMPNSCATTVCVALAQRRRNRSTIAD